MRGYKRIRVFPDRDLRATRLEMAVIDTRLMQRLRDVRQLGQSSVAFPTAEHSRFSHALGALYWTTKMLSHLSENYFSDDNRKLLDKANDTLKQTVLNGRSAEEDFKWEITWFEQLIRLAALLHDITHLPYGHTLEDQAGLLLRHDQDPERIEAVFERLLKEVEDSPHLKIGDGDELHSILRCLLGQCQALYFVGLRLKEHAGPELVQKENFAKWQQISSGIDESFFPYLTLVYDIVNNTICADLIDYLHRDTLSCGIPWTLDKVLFSHMKVLQTLQPSIDPAYPAELFRFGVGIGRNGKLRHDVVTAVLSLLRTRYDITEKVYYHHTKCAADAMLEKAIRASEIELDWRTILNEYLGDEGFFHYLEGQFNGKGESSLILKKLRSRRFHKAVYRLSRSGWSGRTREAIQGASISGKEMVGCNKPSGRTKIENTIAEECKIRTGAVIVSCLPWNMQLKEAEALVQWTDGDLLHLSALPREKGYLPEVTNLTARYYDLWSLTVYLDPEFETYVAIIEGICERLFDQKNDPLIAEYIRIRYPNAFKVKEITQSIAGEAEVGVVSHLTALGRTDDAIGEGSVKETVLIEMHGSINAKIDSLTKALQDTPLDSQLALPITPETVRSLRDKLSDIARPYCGEDCENEIARFCEDELDMRSEHIQEAFLNTFADGLPTEAGAYARPESGKGKAINKTRLRKLLKGILDQLDKTRNVYSKDD